MKTQHYTSNIYLNILPFFMPFFLKGLVLFSIFIQLDIYKTINKLFLSIQKSMFSYYGILSLKSALSFHTFNYNSNYLFQNFWTLENDIFPFMFCEKPNNIKKPIKIIYKHQIIRLIENGELLML